MPGFCWGLRRCWGSPALGDCLHGPAASSGPAGSRGPRGGGVAGQAAGAGSGEGREGGGAAGGDACLPALRRLSAGLPGTRSALASPWALETGWCQGRGPALPWSRRCAETSPPRVLPSSDSLALVV